MADTEVVSGAPEAVRSWGGGAMKHRKKSKGMFTPGGGDAMAKHGGKGGDTMPQPKKKKQSGKFGRGGY